MGRDCFNQAASTVLCTVRSTSKCFYFFISRAYLNFGRCPVKNTGISTIFSWAYLLERTTPKTFSFTFVLAGLTATSSHLNPENTVSASDHSALPKPFIKNTCEAKSSHLKTFTRIEKTKYFPLRPYDTEKTK